MAKKRVMYECMACGYESPRWLGKCPECGGWNQMEEQLVAPPTIDKRVQVQTSKQPLSRGAKQLHEIQYTNESRVNTDFSEFDRVLGGGVVNGSLVLIGGDPGIGKSTLLLQVSLQLANKGQKLLYVSGEESLSQIKMRAERLSLNSDYFYLLSETDLTAVASEIQRIEPDMVIIDSIQTMTSPEHNGVAGSVSQLRETTNVLMRIAKDNQIAIFIVGHVTKEGNIAGPRMLEHMVDTVLYFEGEKHNRFRILRAVKNRFGSTNELGVFEMLDVGLQEVTNPSELFLEERLPGATGSTVVAALEGTRTILAEIQSLMTPTVFGNAKRTASGIEQQRVSLLLAVMEKHCGLMVQNQDAFFKTTGGVQLDEPAIDLAIAMSIASSYWNRPTQIDDCFVGEIGLTGEIRRVTQVKERIVEADKLGFKRIFVPKNNVQSLVLNTTIEVIPVSTIKQALAIVFPR
ncbi:MULTISPECIES: DNA repair protein RadA [unclassified Facklamia]|uniref:DNA repair protein RadA n=1 Tax=Aerococcaceae TaxID=186827 RepID=UPI0013B5DF83|nr:MULTISPECIES: DNA repair protein RadA [unclassified Facklamia]NEW64993.1 DNA repair protein RadA [Facklamia sp. 252]NEW68454.1 DNA repair protein RadA [Facklamia sp. 253]QQD65591.1 DNA repair protein RadA [Aerococcaceae bacterium zg-252]